MKILKPFMVWLFFSILFSSVNAQVSQRQINFTNFKINNLYSSTDNGGTITIPYTAVNKSVSRIDATVKYEEPAGHTNLNYIIDLEVTGADGTTLHEQAATIAEGELHGSNSVNKGIGYDDMDRTDFPIKIKAKIYWRDDENNTNGNGIWYFASTGEFTVNLEADPNAISNNNICLNQNFSNCNTPYNYTGSSITNLPIYGTSPAGGNGVYTYSWQASYNGQPWVNLEFNHSQNFIGINTSADRTMIRRVITSTGTSPSYSNAITLNISLCDRPEHGICDNQFYYNCIPGQAYYTRSIQASPYWDYVDNGKHKVVWEIGDSPDGPWRIVHQTTSGDEFSGFSYGHIEKSTTSPTDIYYIRRLVKVKDCFIFCSDWYTVLTSNVLRIVLSQCPDPRNSLLLMKGPTSAKCTDVQLNYSVDLTVDCGIANIQWSAPAGWTFLTPSSGPNVKGVSLNPFNGSNVNSGNVTARVTYLDGHVVERSTYVTGQAAPILTETAHNWPIRICDGQNSVFTVTGSGGLAPYTCEWHGTNLNYTSTTSGNVFTAVINPVQAGGSHFIKGVIVDANGCKATSNNVEVNDGTHYWLNGTPWGIGTNLPVADINWIEDPQYVEATDAVLKSEARGNIYYIAKVGSGQFKLATVQWDNAASQWRNFTFPKVNAPSASSGSLGIRELTPGHRTIFYVGLDKKIHSISSINGYQNEFIVTNNWTSEVIYPNTQDVKYIMHVNKDYVIYKNYMQQVFAMTVNGSVILVDGSIVEGNNAAISGNNIFYVKNGNLFCKSITTMYQTGIVSKVPGHTRAALPHTDIEIYGGYLYFTGADRHIKRVSMAPGTVYYLTPTSEPSDATAIRCNGFFSINKNTGVVYFVGELSKTTLNQLFYNSALGWKTKQISDGDHGGSVSYTTPNAFYIDYFGVIKFTFFYMNVCNPSIIRTSGEMSQNEDQIDGLGTPPVNYGEVNVVMYPNPTTRELNINVEGVMDENLSYVLSDLSGKELDRYTGSYIDLGERTPGIYLLSIYQSDVLLKVEKVVVK